jgi:succinate dehydrogenase flavin-adding protein (antitoxin of CptAB toxin-antitoxin module)
MDNLAVRRKRLRHRSRYRGFLESDLLFERFVEHHLEALDERQLDLLEALLDEDDQDTWAWVTGKEPVPQRHDNDVMVMLRSTGTDG